MNRKSVYEPTVKQRCKQLVCSKGKATTIIVISGLLILIIAVVASLARSSGSNCDHATLQQSRETTTPLQSTSSTPTEQYIATNGKKFPWHSVRLPQTIKPLEYDIFLHPNLTKRIFEGKVKITCKVLNKTNQIILHIKKLNLTKVEVSDVKTGKNIEVTERLEYKKGQQLLLQLERDIEGGTSIDVKIRI